MFYHPEPLQLQLDADESQHCYKVLRKNVGNNIVIFDGNGKSYSAELTKVGKVCAFKIIKTFEHLSTGKLTKIAIAPPKKAARFDFLMEKLVELGVNEVYLLDTQNSERNRINESRLRKQVITACKQSRQYYMPKIVVDIKLKDLVDFETPLYVCHCEESSEKLSLKDFGTSSDGIWCIGPEGDFSSAEISMFKDNKATMVDLGAMRLRTETAAIYIASWLKFIGS